MMNETATCQAVLLVRLGAPDSPESSVDEIPRAQLQEQLSFIEAALRDCGLCRGTWSRNNDIAGLFPTADAAFEVACSVQQACTEHFHASVRAGVRILLDKQHTERTGEAAPSPVAESGAAVKQLVQQVPPGQIFATRSITGRLTELSRARFRLYERATAGADAGSPLYQVICNEETITRIAIPTRKQEKTHPARNLYLRWRDNTLTLGPESPSVTIGRGDQSDIQIESELASRVHARLGFHETNFILTDQSTNGTFVQIERDDEVRLHHEQIVLRGSGVISLGRRIRGSGRNLIFFTLTTDRRPAGVND
jgi:adenylate cyclase